MDREELIFALKVLPKDKTEKEFYLSPNPSAYLKCYKLLERLRFVEIRDAAAQGFVLISVTGSGLQYLLNYREDSSITALFYKITR